MKTFLLGILGGAFIGFGSFMAISIGGACPGLVATNPGLQKMVYGAFGLPFGLFLVLLCGAELFTGNTALLTAAVRPPPEYGISARTNSSHISCTVMLPAVKHTRPIYGCPWQSLHTIEFHLAMLHMCRLLRRRLQWASWLRIGPPHT